MNLILVKMFATALALSQVTTRPDAVKTEFDPINDQAEVVQILREGCAHIRKEFDVEDFNLDDLIQTAMQDPQGVTGEMRAFKGINFDELLAAYKMFCSNEKVDTSIFDFRQVIEFYNRAAAGLPDHTRLKGLKLPGTSVVLDNKGNKFAELFESDHRRVWVPLNEIPDYVKQAFIAAEDKRFYQHRGVDERGLIRAFIANMAQPGRPQGGSTITQQVAKNLLVGDDVSYERKIREMLVAVRIDRDLTKDEILEVYINSIYLGRGSWGIDMAARSYFKKPASALTLGEATLLAGLAKGPAYFSPDRYPRRARERQAYVLKRLEEDKVITAEQAAEATKVMSRIVPYERPRRSAGFYFTDHIVREARSLVGMQSLTVDSYVVHSTINVKLQAAAEEALQEGLFRYELAARRLRFEKPETNISALITRIDAEQKTRAQRRGMVAHPLWQQAMQQVHLPLYDVHWTPAVVLEKRNTEGGAVIKVGLADGRIMPLSTPEGVNRRSLGIYDVVYVKVVEGKSKNDVRAELRVRPKVQGAAIVLENKSGRILAMVGGFSYVLSQLNRTTQSYRQPGSSIKPLVYATALHKRLQPNTLILDQPITLPPIPGSSTHYWTPKNYDRGGGGAMTLRRALEQSKNLVTARLLAGGIDHDPLKSLEAICALALEAKVYSRCMHNYPFVLGAQAVRPIDLAAFYAAIASEGARFQPYAIDKIESNGLLVYQRPPTPPVMLASGDRVAFYQLRTILEGVVARGTAVSIKQHAGYIGGKTGTTDSENDVWFAGFTSDVTIVVWVGYDNAAGKRTLGSGFTGGRVAVPIVEAIAQASWQYHAPKTPLPPPSAEAQRRMRAIPIDVATGRRVPAGSQNAFLEYFRLDDRGRLYDTQHALVGRSVSIAGDREHEIDRREVRSSAEARGLPTNGRRPNSGFNFFGLLQ
ncbi:MAG TPA: transglycosylase domain-containing protein [Xanthobacteraceae bacterium]|nr:transglycosylase domain-containing protein [Xanthobacteraceae bacterium]